MRTAIFAGLVFMGTMMAINKLTDNELHLVNIFLGVFIIMDTIEFLNNL